MESCKAGLENRINAKEAQETLKCLAKRATMPWNLVTKLASRVSLVQSQVTKQETFEARNVAFVEHTCHFVGNKYQFFIPGLCQRACTIFSSTLRDNS